MGWNSRCPNDVIYRTGQHSVFAREKAPSHDVSVVFVVRRPFDVQSALGRLTNATIDVDLSSVETTISGLSANPSANKPFAENQRLLAKNVSDDGISWSDVPSQRHGFWWPVWFSKWSFHVILVSYQNWVF